MREAENILSIEGKLIGGDQPTYFIADIAANHDGDLSRARELIFKAKEAGADAAKFQHFRAENIVSDVGFRALGRRQAHQSSWQKSVFEVYKDASINTEWTALLKETSEQAGIAFFTSPYDFELVDHVDPYVPAYKIGSGDITWIEIIERIASKGKPYFLATGASTMDDVFRAVSAALAINPNLGLLQCNTNYSGSFENMRYINLNVLKSYRAMFPRMVLGLSDHTPGCTTVLGAVALGAKVIEKHFTDDTSRVGPDHSFSMDGPSWREMVDRTRELEASLGINTKKVEDNEQETLILQRRSIRASRYLRQGHIIEYQDLAFLRPCPPDAIVPYDARMLLGRKLRRDMPVGEHFTQLDYD